MVVVVVNAAGRGIHADVIAVFLNGIQQVLQVHAAPTEGDDAGHDRHAAHQMTDLELFLKIKVVDGRRDVEGLTRIAFHVVGHGAGLVDDQQALAGCSGVIPDMVTRILQRLFDELDLIADRLAEGFAGRVPMIS